MTAQHFMKSFLMLGVISLTLLAALSNTQAEDSYVEQRLEHVNEETDLHNAVREGNVKLVE